MNLTLLLLFLHITTMFTAIAVGYGGGLVSRLAFMTGQVAAVRGVGMAMSRLGPAIPLLFMTGGAFGLLTAISFGTNLLSPWLVIAYVLFATAMVIGMVDTAPSARRLGAVLATTPDGPMTPEVAAFFTGRRFWITIIDYLIVAVIIFDMVVKPFSS